MTTITPPAVSPLLALANALQATARALDAAQHGVHGTEPEPGSEHPGLSREAEAIVALDLSSAKIALERAIGFLAACRAELPSHTRYLKLSPPF